MQNNSIGRTFYQQAVFLLSFLQCIFGLPAFGDITDYRNDSNYIIILFDGDLEGLCYNLRIVDLGRLLGDNNSSFPKDGAVFIKDGGSEKGECIENRSSDNIGGQPQDMHP